MSAVVLGFFGGAESQAFVVMKWSRTMIKDAGGGGPLQTHWLLHFADIILAITLTRSQAHLS